MILGHAHPAVVAAVRAQLEHGTTYFLVNEPVVALADELCRAVPCAEQVRFTSTGTEATFFALRAARAYRKREGKLHRVYVGTAEEVTRRLRSLDANDPVRFDFALSHLGISGECASRRDARRCAHCSLKPICRFWT